MLTDSDEYYYSIYSSNVTRIRLLEIKIAVAMAPIYTNVLNVNCSEDTLTDLIDEDDAGLDFHSQ